TALHPLSLHDALPILVGYVLDIWPRDGEGVLDCLGHRGETTLVFVDRMSVSKSQADPNQAPAIFLHSSAQRWHAWAHSWQWPGRSEEHTSELQSRENL